MNFAISDDEKYIVDGVLCSRLSYFDELLDDRSEVSRAAELDAWEVLTIKLQYSLSAENLWLDLISVKREAVIYRCLSYKPWDSSKAIDRERLIIVVCFENGAN